MGKVITLDLAKQLAEAAEAHGVKLPKSEYVHVYYENRIWDICEKSFFDDRRDWFDEWFNAYQTDELLEWMPRTSTIGKPLKKTDLFMAILAHSPKGEDEAFADTPCDALCRLAIDLVEKGIIT